MTCSITTHYVCFGCGASFTFFPNDWQLMEVKENGKVTGSYYLCRRCNNKRLRGGLRYDRL